MTRPQIIRADSLDLQDHDTPSAKEHRQHPKNSTPNGLLAPHQAETIREVEEERAGEEARSPRVSWANGDNVGDLQQYAEDLATGVTNSLNGDTMQQEDALAIAQNGGVAGNASDDGDLDTNGEDDDLDDDMMDKISSSPSIEDGGYTLPPAWPQRVDSLRHSPLRRVPPSSLVFSETRSSSPYPDLVEGYPLQSSGQQASKAPVDVSGHHHHHHHHLPGEYTGPIDHEPHADAPDHMSLLDYESHTEELEHLSPPDPRPNVEANEMVKETTYHTWELTKQDHLPSNRDSGLGIKVEDFSLDRSQSTRLVEPELDEEEYIISPYDLIPYDASESEDDDDFSLADDSRFIDSGFDGGCLQDSEDIDFEFVYALHTFVATVEGQANATKGDTMVLLDDSNSYWWLVRVVKDSSIGYLPAEHIETPTERLARLNKHRNIDLSATMLGDQAEKTKNPLKTAMKRRKAKNVAFAPPTILNYSDPDYSTDEEDREGDVLSQQDAQEQDQQQQSAAQQATIETVEDDESAKVEPLKPRSQKKQVKIEAPEDDDVGASAQDDLQRNSDEIFDGKSERTTRNGTVRNTDSFFKDDTIETKKITLTPGLLRDDNEPRDSSESKDFSLRSRPSFDKELVADKTKDDKKKKDKKDKEKKPSAIRSFFSRKDKKKSVDEDDESFGKRSLDAGAESAEKDTEEPHDMDSSPEKGSGPQRNPSKLQKQQPRSDPSPTRKPAITPQPASLDRDRAPLASEVRTNNVANVPPATLRMVESDMADNEDVAPQKDEKPKSTIAKILPEPRPPKVTKSKARVELDDFDSPEEEEEDMAPEPTRAPPEPQKKPTLERPIPGAFPDSYLGTQPSMSQQGATSTNTQRPGEERLSESPVQVSPITSSNPPPLMVDTSSQEDRSSPVSSPSPELDVDKSHRNQDSVTTSTSATTASTWNDANLRAFFDSGSDIRDLLVVVHDTSDVAPAGPEHPVAGTLFREQNAKLAEITTQLDNMLGDWLARKQRLRGTV